MSSAQSTLPDLNLSLTNGAPASPATDRPGSAEPNPTTTIGIIGGGQLAWLMAGVADRVGLALAVQTPSDRDPAVARVGRWEQAAVADAAATARLAQACQVVTFENEFVDLAGLGVLAAAGVCFRPSLAVLAQVLDKYDQRVYLQSIGLPVPNFAAIDHPAAASQLSQWENGEPVVFPVVAKTRRHGYDGQGTFVIADRAALVALSQRLGDRSLLVEAFVPFVRELAVVAARSTTGDVAVFPIVETQQVDQVCRRVLAPAPIAPEVAEAATTIARDLLSAIDGVGVFGIELFQTADDRLWVNEIAPRVHNSGHFTLDACLTSQFEQHLRAVAGLPLGDPAMTVAAAAMVNLLGFETATHDYREKRAAIADLPGVIVHWYGKSESRPGRKLGHVTVLADQASDLEPAIQAIEALWYGNEARQ